MATILVDPEPQSARPSIPVADAPPPTRTRSRADVAAVVAIACAVVAGAVLRLWGLGTGRLNFDESFTAMAGRLPVTHLFSFLRAHDSHPPLDYLLRAPLARAGASELVFRLPSALCSLAALALFAWWVRGRRFAGVVATVAMAVSAFQLAHGREARMYAVMELVGVAAVVIADAWVRRPRRAHAPVMAVVLLVGLMTHVSGVLLAIGVFALAGLRRDRDAWRWRAGVLAAGLTWAALWGRAFLIQAHGGHSSWIAATTVHGLTNALGRLVTFRSDAYVAVVAAVAFGAIVMWRRDRVLGRVWTCCFAVPVGVGALAGLALPVVIDRTFTVVAWGPLLAIGFALDAVVRRSRTVAAVAFVALLAVMLPSTAYTLTTRSGPDVAIRHLERVVRPGDVVAVRPSWKAVETQWSLGVRGRVPFEPVRAVGVPGADARVLGRGRLSGRVWLLDWHHYALTNTTPCAPTWQRGTSRVECLRVPPRSIVLPPAG